MRAEVTARRDGVNALMPSQPKSTLRTRAQDKASKRYRKGKARRVCTDKLWAGEHYQPCHYCGRYVARGGTFFKAVGGVHEPRARSLGGDPADAQVNVIACEDCHMPNGAHRRSVRAER